VFNPLSTSLGIIKKDWKLLAGLNALYFCVIVIGATLAFISPSLHLSMINSIGSDGVGAPLITVEETNAPDALIAAGYGLAFSFAVNTLAMITAPSIIIPLWAPIIGAARFFLWGVAYVLPTEGITMGSLIPQYVTILLEGEAYIVAIFACVRMLIVALNTMDYGLAWMKKRYWDSVVENANLLAIVLVLLAAAALYQAFVLPYISL
jgi:hypothetical protein